MRTRDPKPGLLAAASVLAVALQAPRAATAADAAEQTERMLSGMNPFILTNLVSERVVLEVDWVEGYPPAPEALRAAEKALRRHCEAGKQLVVRIDDEIPRVEWEAAEGRPGLERLVARRLDGDPADWQRAELVYLLYVPDHVGWYDDEASGMTDRIRFATEGGVKSVDTVLLFTDELRRDAAGRITVRKLERSTLVHELGHVLGLVSNPAHVQANHRRHCSSARCVMHNPGRRAWWVRGIPALFGHVPSRYGRRCRRDIRTVRRLWAERAVSSPRFVEQLVARRMFRDAIAADEWRSGP